MRNKSSISTWTQFLKILLHPMLWTKMLIGSISSAEVSKSRNSLIWLKVRSAWPSNRTTTALMSSRLSQCYSLRKAGCLTRRMEIQTRVLGIDGFKLPVETQWLFTILIRMALINKRSQWSMTSMTSQIQSSSHTLVSLTICSTGPSILISTQLWVCQDLGQTKARNQFSDLWQRWT